MSTNKKQSPPNICFIDGQNLETGLYTNGYEADYELLITYLKEKYNVTKVYYCIKYFKSKERIAHIERLKPLGYYLIFSSGMGNKGESKYHKVNVDADLIVKALEEYFVVGKYGLILISGDGDFIPLIRFFEKQNQFVKIICADRNSASAMLSNDRYTKRNLTYIYPELQKLIQKISPPD
jgi:uncharacterized LabA/DUF88 family protein